MNVTDFSFIIYFGSLKKDRNIKKIKFVDMCLKLQMALGVYEYWLIVQLKNL